MIFTKEKTEMLTHCVYKNPSSMGLEFLWFSFTSIKLFTLNSHVL